jgi:A/G-specific adenine glycosylase
MTVDTAAELLAWYDVHRRTLPWRAPAGGGRADPYAVWLSEIMLQQTTVAAVGPYYRAFLARWPRVEALAAERDDALMSAWAGLGYYARARNLLACARMIVRDHDGCFPQDEDALRALPGIGAYTAAAISAIAFDRRAVVVDGNVERVISRLFALQTPLPAARSGIRRLADRLTPDTRPGDFAQAMMDLGSMICTPRRPACPLCPLRAACAAGPAGDAELYPMKAKKAAKPHRHGTAFWVEAAGHVLLVMRPPKGLLGGMRTLPTGPWSEDEPALSGAPIDAGWSLAGRVRHVFTHFSLDLTLACASLPQPVDIVGGTWWPIESIDAAGLPTVFAKAARLQIGDRAPMAGG